MKILLALAAASLSPEQTASLNKVDFLCVEASGWGIAHAGKDSRFHFAMEMMHYYYLGRLYGRDGSTDWMKEIFADLAKHKSSKSYYILAADACSKRFNKVLPAKTWYRVGKWDSHRQRAVLRVEASGIGPENAWIGSRRSTPVRPRCWRPPSPRDWRPHSFLAWPVYLLSMCVSDLP